MNSPTPVENDLAPATLPSGTDLPAHLHGLRQAIFHLLRQPPVPDEAPRRRLAAAPPEAHTAFPVRVRNPAADDIGLPVFFQEDQFEFLSVEAKAATAASHAVRPNQPIS